MGKTAARLATTLVLALWVTSPVSAQELVLGTWTGMMFPPGGQSVAVSYEVGESGGDLSIVMSAPEMGQSIAFSNVHLDGDELTFWWEPGPRVDCTLHRQEDGSFEGICTDGGGGDGTLRMVPPSGEHSF